ncbi:YibE/F family protein [Anaerocolumna sp. MB42-C2]|uniref:YibE/F family protein n=1 Tax=Anaerocolumna sp. MB42-C2 TaxID=3070997 RepID=UPI0027DF2FB7|nr:YibE/F family protein [Anaerocolumna sp. MB42-C2]WMJ87053.1 YibE/F family protein [Anaerocolumna sp. MB42-C2]
MNVIIILAAILFILMKLIGKEKGVKSFFSLLINFFILYVAIILIAHNLNSIFITLLACFLISYITLFYINGISTKTIAAFLSTIVTLIALYLFIYLIGTITRIQGFGEEEFEEISIYSLYIGIDFTQVVISTIIIGLIGAIIDTAISISSSMNEVFLHNQSITRHNLFESGLNISRDILGTTTNTLYFAFVGGYMALILWLKDLNYSFGKIINSKIFCSEIISILCSGLGVALIIPITAGITSYLLTSRRGRESMNSLTKNASHEE